MRSVAAGCLRASKSLKEIGPANAVVNTGSVSAIKIAPTPRSLKTKRVFRVMIGNPVVMARTDDRRDNQLGFISAMVNH